MRIKRYSKTYNLYFRKVFDKNGKVGTSSVTLEVMGKLTITSPANNATVKKNEFIDVTFSNTGGQLNNISLIVSGEVATQCTPTKCVWKVTNDPGSVQVLVRGKKSGETFESNTINVTVEPAIALPTL